MIDSRAGSRVTWLIVIMASLMFINFIDRGNLATVGPLLIDELHLSNTQFGLLLSAFYFSYAPAQLLTGWLCERTNIFMLLGFGVAVWSLTTAATGLVSGFSALLAMRILLGLGESIVFPACSKLFAQFIPEHRRGSANGWAAAGLSIGPAVGTLIGTWLAAGFGWRASFLVFGLLSLMWLWPWARFSRTLSLAPIQLTGPLPSYREMMTKRAAWGAFLGHFSSNFSFYALISWLPTYLVKVRGLSMQEMGIVGGLTFYSVIAMSAVLAGIISDRLIVRGRSVTTVRKSCIVVAQVGVGVCLLVCAYIPFLAAAGLLVSAVFLGMVSPSLYSIAQTLAGTRAAGQWMGMQNFFGNLAGIIAPFATGLLIDRYGNYDLAFVLASAVTFAGAAAWGLMIARVEPIKWQGNPDASVAPAAKHSAQ